MIQLEIGLYHFLSWEGLVPRHFQATVILGSRVLQPLSLFWHGEDHAGQCLQILPQFIGHTPAGRPASAHVHDYDSFARAMYWHHHAAVGLTTLKDRLKCM
jgi:hypothetical protein